MLAEIFEERMSDVAGGGESGEIIETARAARKACIEIDESYKYGGSENTAELAEKKKAWKGKAGENG